MIFTIHLAFVVTLIYSGSCEQLQQEDSLQHPKLHQWIPTVRRTYRSLSALPVPSGGGKGVPNGLPLTGLTTPEYRVQLRPQAPRWPTYGTNGLSIYPADTNLLRTYRRYRSSLPATSLDNPTMDDVENTVEQLPSVSQQTGRLRFLGWLFGRPPISPYPDYSVLEQAAGLPYGSRRPPVEYGRPHSPVLVEECVELLDPYTDHIIEECRDVPTYHHY